MWVFSAVLLVWTIVPFPLREAESLIAAVVVSPNDRPVHANGRKLIKNFDHTWYSMMAAITFSTLSTAKCYCIFWLALLHESTSNRSTHCILSTSLNYHYEQRNLRFITILDHWLFQVGCQIVVSTDAGLTVSTESAFSDNKYCFNLVLLWILKYLVIVLTPWIHMQLEGFLVIKFKQYVQAWQSIAFLKSLCLVIHIPFEILTQCLSQIRVHWQNTDVTSAHCRT